MLANHLSVAAMLTGAVGLGLVGLAAGPRHPASAASRLPVEGEMPPLDGATEWLNSPPLTAGGLRGKVVLVDIWTYTCINWLRTLPYVRAWAAKYKDQGLVVIACIRPSSLSEKDAANVRRSAKQMMVDYPIAVDSDHAVWRAFHNEYWPALYLVDAKGHIRYHQFGEGEYERTEQVIRQLLTEAGGGDAGSSLTAASVDGRGIEAAADWRDLKSGENYVGFERTENFASPGGAARGGRRLYSVPPALKLNQWAVSGEWTVAANAIALHGAGGRITYRFHARDLHLVMGPPSGIGNVRFRVRIDGKPPDAAHGIDVDAEGNGTASEQRLYQLIRQPAPITDRQFEIEFLDPGVEAFAFTFG